MTGIMLYSDRKQSIVHYSTRASQDRQALFLFVWNSQREKKRLHPDPADVLRMLKSSEAGRRRSGSRKQDRQRARSISLFGSFSNQKKFSGQRAQTVTGCRPEYFYSFVTGGRKAEAIFLSIPEPVHRKTQGVFPQVYPNVSKHIRVYPPGRFSTRSDARRTARGPRLPGIYPVYA